MSWFDITCISLSILFFWSTFVLLIGLLVPSKRHVRRDPKIRFAVLVCARNEESVIRLPVKSVLRSRYPAALRTVIVLADNCTDRTAEIARAAGAVVWEKTTPSSGKGDVLAWGVNRVVEDGSYDAIAVFDADNVACASWLERVNDVLLDGECVVTGCRHASNAGHGVIPGWYAIYWDMMNELSNRVRTNLGLSSKLTGTGFAFLLSALAPGGWKTSTMVEDVEFTVQLNLRGNRIAYVPEAHYADEQPETSYSMWRQLRRWSTGGWQVLARYAWPWLLAVACHPSFRLIDSFFAIVTGVSVAFIHLFNVLGFGFKVWLGESWVFALTFHAWVLVFVVVMSWFAAAASVALSQRRRRPGFMPILLFPVFTFILSASVLYTLVRPTKCWKPIVHKGC